MNDEEMFDATSRQRHRLADTLGGFDDDQWDHDSLCDGWRARDVLGHLVAILDTPIWRLLLGIARARGFDRYMAGRAVEFGARPPAELLARYRELADRRFSPPGVGAFGPLADVCVHTRDIERPLGIGATLDPEVVRFVLDRLVSKPRGFVPTDRFEGLALEATDLDWRAGEGAAVAGPGEALLLAMLGRRPALADLTGDGVAQLDRHLG